MSIPAHLEPLLESEPQPDVQPAPQADPTPAVTPATVIKLQQGAGNQAVTNALTKRKQPKNPQAPPAKKTQAPPPKKAQAPPPKKAQTPPPKKGQAPTQSAVVPNNPYGLSNGAWKKLGEQGQKDFVKDKEKKQKEADADAAYELKEAAYERAAAPKRAILLPQLERHRTDLQAQVRPLQTKLKAWEEPPASLTSVIAEVRSAIPNLEVSKKADPDEVLTPKVEYAAGLLQRVQHELARPVLTAAEAAEAAEANALDRLKDDVLGFVPQKFLEAEWKGGWGPDFEFRVSRGNKDALFRYCRTEFGGKVIPGWEGKKDDTEMKTITNWTNKTVRYYVTETSTSGAAFNISAHIYEGNRDTRRTMVVLHIPLYG